MNADSIILLLRKTSGVDIKSGYKHSAKKDRLDHALSQHCTLLSTVSQLVTQGPERPHTQIGGHFLDVLSPVGTFLQP